MTCSLSSHSLRRSASSVRSDSYYFSSRGSCRPSANVRRAELRSQRHPRSVASAASRCPLPDYATAPDHSAGGRSTPSFASSIRCLVNEPAVTDLPNCEPFLKSLDVALHSLSEDRVSEVFDAPNSSPGDTPLQVVGNGIDFTFHV